MNAEQAKVGDIIIGTDGRALRITELRDDGVVTEPCDLRMQPLAVSVNVFDSFGNPMERQSRKLLEKLGRR